MTRKNECDFQHDFASTYLQSLAKLCRGARLNHLYPEPKSIGHLLSLLEPKRFPLLNSSVTLDKRSGFPNNAEVTKILSERENALHTQQVRASRIEQPESPAAQRYLERLHFHSQLLSHPLPSLFSTRIRVRRHLIEEQAAQLEANYTCWDPVISMFVKYTILFTQTGWQQSQGQQKSQSIEVDGERLKITSNFRNMLAHSASSEAELTFILLNKQEDIEVEEVVRTQIGPYWEKNMDWPQQLKSYFTQNPHSHILHLPLERVTHQSSPIRRKEHSNRDPFSRLLIESFDDYGKEVWHKETDSMFYQVYKERKFAVNKSNLKDWKSFLKQHGHSCITYGVTI